jgi:hypothetical protein
LSVENYQLFADAVCLQQRQRTGRETLTKSNYFGINKLFYHSTHFILSRFSLFVFSLVFRDRILSMSYSEGGTDPRVFKEDRAQM